MRRLLSLGALSLSALSLAVMAGSLSAVPSASAVVDRQPGRVAPASAGDEAARTKPRKPRKKNPDGHYVGSESPEQDPDFDDIVFDFDVRSKGRRITDFTFAMNVVCSGYPLYTEYVVQPMNDMRVNPRTGRFADVVTGTTDGGTAYEVRVSGRLKGTRVRAGTMSYDVGVCQRGTDDTGPAGWVAARTSKGFG